MNTKTPFILGGLCLALFAFVFLVESKWESTDDKMKKGKRLYSVKSSDIEKISIRNKNYSVVLKKNKGEWALHEPLNYPASKQEVNLLLTDLEFLDNTRAFEMKDKEKEIALYSLKDPVTVLRANWGKDEQIELRIGGETPTGGGVYAQTQKNSDRVLVIPKALPETLAKPVEFWRSKDIVSLKRTELKSVTIKTRVQEIEVAKKNGAWRIERPLVARADEQRINSLISSLASAKAEGFASDSDADLEAYGLREPALEIRIRHEKEDADSTLLFSDPSKTTNGMIYAKQAGTPNVLTVKSDTFSMLSPSLPSLRNRAPSAFQRHLVQGIAISRNATSFEAIKEGDQWKTGGSDSVTLSPKSAETFLDKLLKLEATDFVADSPSDLKKYGLETPDATITLTLTKEQKKQKNKKEETNSDDAPESTTETLSLLIGKSDKNGVYLLNRPENTVYTVKSDALSFIEFPSWEWFDTTVLKTDANNISALTLTKTGTTTTVRRTDQGWTADPGEANSAAIDSIATLVSTLRAQRWLGPQPKLPSKKPNITYAFSTAGKDYTLRLYDCKEGKPCVAYLEGGTPLFFELGDTDVTFLLQPLTVERAPKTP